MLPRQYGKMMLMKEYTLHPAQSSTLFELRHTKRARFSDLLRTTTLTSDSFKFHLRKLTALGLITKDDDGLYILTPRGKEFANRLDEKTGMQIMQPKCSMLLMVASVRHGETVYLAHMRQREPFYGFWGIGSAPVVRGMSLVDSATHELKKQSGIDAKFTVKSMLRVIDKNPDGEVLEDKLFGIMYAILPEPVQPHEWYGGHSEWLTREELLAKKPLFPTTTATFDIIESGLTFDETTCVYTDDEY